MDILMATLALMLSLNLIVVQICALKVSISIPELVKLNDAFWLNCSHQKLDRQPNGVTVPDLENLADGISDKQQKLNNREEDIYAIKWYKDDEEFYRFLPNAQPKVSIYETNGIQLDQTRSHDGNVLLSKADINSEGNYRCEILSEAPLFETVRKSKHLKVYALPVRGPRIEILDSNGKAKSPKAQEISYSVGDKIELRCNSAPSKPAARLRWYLNDHELMVPQIVANLTDRQRRNPTSGQPHSYDVRITPIEYRQHYKGIYSSHSTLSLILHQDDLINNKISFKCLASMREDISIRSKQLIVLTPQSSSSGAKLRARRFLSDLVTTLGSSDSDAHVHHRQRPQHHRHSVSRLQQQSSTSSLPSSSPLSSSSSSSSSFSSRTQLQPKSALSSDSINNLLEDSKNQMMYIYEDSDSTLGSSIIDKPDNLETYLRKSRNETENTIYQSIAYSNYGLEFNRADNLEYIQLLRERQARQRSFPGSQQTNTVGSSGGGSTNSHNLKRLHGASSLVKSPFYLDENDSLRPIINWPPLDSGKLMLLSPGHSIVAIPTQKHSLPNEQQRFIFPSKEEFDSINTQSIRSKIPLIEDTNQIKQVILERLVNNLNCTCTDGSIDTKLGWLINDTPLETRDTRFYPTRISPDHRQTWLTVGLQVANKLTPSTVDNLQTRLQHSSSSLHSILGEYFRSSDSQDPSKSTQTNTGFRLDPKLTANNQQSAHNDQIKFICQAIQSMLLHSSSEMITFDFNPPPSAPIDGNSIDKFASLPNNVIQATSASQNSSAQGRNSIIISLRSQVTLLSLLMSILLFMCIANHPSSNFFAISRFVSIIM